MHLDLLLARTEDIINTVFLTDKPAYLGFLSLEEATLIKRFLDNKNIRYMFYGGENNLQRVMLCCMPEWLQKPDFPICGITVSYRLADKLHHRDFLGSLMGLGLKRETVGDILIEDGRAVVFLKDDIANFVIENLKTVGKIGVSIKKGYSYPLPQTDELKDFSVTVASCRLDCVVSACTSCSRGTATAMIENSLVKVNSLICEKPTKIIVDGDVLSVRGKGKYKIVSTGSKTKKDRVILKYKKYQ